MEQIVIVSVLSFLLGLAVGIIGYSLTTIVAYEKEIEAIFNRMCMKYQKKLEYKEKENDRLHDTVLDLQVKLAKKENPGTNNRR